MTFAKSIELIVLTDRRVTVEINCVKRLSVKVWNIFCPWPFLPSFPLTPLIPRHLMLYKGLAWKGNTRFLQYLNMTWYSVVECSINDLVDG